MNAQKTVLLKLLPAMAALLLGCIAQSGAPEDQTSSSSEALTGSAESPAEQQAEQQRVRITREGVENVPVERQDLEPHGLSSLPKGLAAPTAPGTDSQGGGDGEDPTPVPWKGPPNNTAPLTNH
jgi:hypothetical protein